MMTGVAEMYIYDTNTYVGPNDGAVKIARQMVDVLRLMTVRICVSIGLRYS